MRVAGKKSSVFFLIFGMLGVTSGAGFAGSVNDIDSEDRSWFVAPPPVEETRPAKEALDSGRIRVLSQSNQHSIGNPSDEEQFFVELINRARADAPAEANRLAYTDDPLLLNAIDQFSVDLDEMIRQFGELEETLPPLVINAALTEAARLHSRDMLDNVFQGHLSSASPPAPFAPESSVGERVDAVGGYSWSGLNENVFARARTVFHGHAGFQIDWGNEAWHGMQVPPGHRLAIHHQNRRDIGVGVFMGENSDGGDSVGPIIVTQLFGTEVDANPMVTGVVYYDLDGNGFYGPGEGVGGIRVDSDAGPAWAETAESGGYAFPVPGSATYEVRFSDSGFPDEVRSVTFGGSENRKVDLLLPYQAPSLTGPSAFGSGATGSYAVDPVFGATDYRIEVFSVDSNPWEEGAENGEAFVSIDTGGGYPVIQDQVVAEGNYAFHLAHPEPRADEILLLDRVVLPGTSSALQFQSRFALGTTNQTATVEVSHDGERWDVVYEQVGVGSPGESSFHLRTVSLDTYAGEAVQIRFRYRHGSGSYYPQTGTGVGWLVDAITLTNSYLLEEIASETTGASTEFTFDPPAPGEFRLRVQPVNHERVLPPGTLFPVSVVDDNPAPPEIAVSYNGTNITDGDNTPSTGEGTDFGSLDYTSGSFTRTYRVHNTGGQTLTLRTATSSSGHFIVSGLASSIAPGSFDDFTVTFDPTSAGTKTATISFPTNDADENPFTFAVRGEGFEPSGPSWARPSGWMWTQGEWEWSNSGQYWYWIPPGPPFVQNASTGEVVARPINGWNFYNWPYFWNAEQGVWYFIFQGNLPYVLNPDTGQWRRWGE